MRVFGCKFILELCITGLKHYGFIWEDGLQKQKLIFVREPDNEYDENAIKVLLNDKQIGYITRDDAEQLAPYLDGNPTLQPCKWGRDHDNSNNGYMVIQTVMKCDNYSIFSNNIS